MKISVIIPFYNLERYVDACLASVLSLPRTNDLEVICVDDGSTDGTAVALDAYVPRVRVIHKSNGGEGSARNAGLDVATGDWITFLDGDDVWLPNHLAMAERLLADHSDADILGLKYASFDDGEPLPEPQGAGETQVFDTMAAVPDEAILAIGVFPTFFRRSFVEARRFSALPLGADRLFMAECLADARCVVWAPAIVYGYRVREGSMARAVWNARKVTSQCDYAYNSLKALVASGKRLGPKGQGYLASLWLSDVATRLRRLPRGERRAAWRHWMETLRNDGLLSALPRYDRARRLLRVCGFSMTVSLGLAWLLRKGGLT